MKGRWESNINVWFSFIYSQKTVQPPYFQNRNYNVLSPNSYTHISVIDLYISRVGLSFSMQPYVWTDPGIYKSLTDARMWEIGTGTAQFPENEYINRIFVAVHSTYLGSAWRNSCSPPCPWAWSRQSASPAPVASSHPGRWAPSPGPRPLLPPPSSPSAGSCTPSLPPALQPRTIGAAKKRDVIGKKRMSSARKGCHRQEKDVIGGKRRLLQRIGVIHGPNGGAKLYLKWKIKPSPCLIIMSSPVLSPYLWTL